MSDGSWELQQAVYAALAELDPPLVANGVHAPANQDHPLPYVEIGEADSVAADVQCRDGLEETLTIHVWTAPDSQGPAKQIISRVRDALHNQSLAVSGRASAFATVRSTRLFPDEDDQALHGVITLRVLHYAAI